MDAHEREAAAAVAGMVETYGPHGPSGLPAEGSEVTGCTGNRRFSGIVQSAEPGRVVVEIDGAWLIVRPWEIDSETRAG